MQNNSILENVKSAYYVNRKKDFDKQDSFISRYIYRIASFYVTVPFVKLGFSANQVTAISFIVSILGMIFLSIGEHTAVIAGSILCAFSVLLDYVDGNIARLTAKTSYFGKFIDGLVDSVVSAFMPIAVSFGLYLRPDRIMVYIDNNFDKSVILLIGTLTAIMICLQTVIAFRFQFVLNEAQLIKHKNFRSDHGKTDVDDRFRRTSLYKIGYGIKYFLKTEAYFMLGGIVIFATADIMSIYLLIRWIARSLDCLMEFIKVLLNSWDTLNIYRRY